MKILVLVHGFPPHAQGGAEIYADIHARALHRGCGDDVLVLTRESAADRPEYAVRTERREGLRIVWINNTFRQTRSFAETYQNDAITSIAARIIDDFQPHVAHIHHLTGLSTTIVAQLREREIPIFVTLHDYWLMCHRGQLLDTDYNACDGPAAGACGRCIGVAGGVNGAGFLAATLVRALERQLPSPAARRLKDTATKVAAMVASPSTASDQADARVAHMRRICGDVTCFLAPSRHLRDRFVSFGIEPGRIVEHGYGFDVDQFKRINRSPSTRLRLGFLGSLMVSKAPHLLLEAATRLPAQAVSIDLFGAPVAYHGDDSYRQTLAPLLNHPGVRIHGPIPHDEVPRALGEIDVLVVPSIWPENSPLVIREAYLAGIPVVASRIGGIPEIVDHERNGLLFQPGDAADLARTLSRLLNEPDLYDRLRDGIPAVRTIADDVAVTRERYHAHIRLDRHSSKRALRPRARTAAIVLNYRTPDETVLAVNALLAAHPPIDDVFVVDNSEMNGLGDALTGARSRITHLRCGHNGGFSSGMNAGIREALASGADRIALVNSDAIVPPDCFDRLERRLLASANAGIAGPLILSRSTPDRIASAGISYVAASGRMRHRLAGVALDASVVNNLGTADAVSGCVMYIKRDVFDAIGLLHEPYFYSFEDIDFCLRARRAGFDVVIDPSAVVYHEGGRSIGRDDPRRLYFAVRNHLLLAKRLDEMGAPFDSLRSLRAFDSSAVACHERGRGAAESNGFKGWCRAASIVALNVAHACRSNGSALPIRLAAVARGVADYVGGRFGDG